MLSHSDLAGELEAVAQEARQLADRIKSNGDIPARRLAGAYVEAATIGDRLAKLQKQLGGGNGQKAE